MAMKTGRERGIEIERGDRDTSLPISISPLYLHQQSGQAVVLVVLLLPVFVLLAALALDLYSLTTTRAWAYRAAAEAALHGASVGRDWEAFYVTGVMSLNESLAGQVALDTLNAELSRRGLSASSIDIRVLPDGGSISHYPPQARADQWNAGSWSSPQPAVSVYVSVPVTTTLLGLAGSRATELHVFATASVAR
jgi:hypothetical protein